MHFDIYSVISEFEGKSTHEGEGEREQGSDCNAHSENICDVIELSVKVHLNVPIPIIIAVTKLDDFWNETQLSRIEIKQSTKHTCTFDI